MKFYHTVLMILLISSLNAQDTTLIKSHEVVVTGSSTLHDWSVQVPEVAGYLIHAGQDLKMVQLRFEVNSMEGGRGPTMNDKIKKALSNDTHPWVTFKTDNIESNGDQIKATGKVNIGGVEQPVELSVSKEMTDDSSTYSATADLTFSQFEITPPSAMFGQIKCGDRISLQFKLSF